MVPRKNFITRIMILTFAIILVMTSIMGNCANVEAASSGSGTKAVKNPFQSGLAKNIQAFQSQKPYYSSVLSSWYNKERNQQTRK